MYIFSNITTTNSEGVAAEFVSEIWV